MPDLPPSTGTASSSITLDRFSQILDKLYEAALNPDGWEGCLESIRHELQGNYVSLIVRTVTAEDTGLIVSVSEGRRALELNTPNLSVSPFTGVQPDRLVTNADVISDAEWRASAYYRDWCAPHDVYHVMAADIGTREGEVYGFRVTRGEQAPPFSAADKDLGRRLIPHIKRALNLHQSIHQDRKVLSLYSRAMAQLLVGVVVLDKDCNVIECNPAAKSILDMQDGLRVAGHQLEATYANDNRKLQRMVKDALSHNAGTKIALTEALSISRPSGQLAWGVVVQSISPDQWTEGKQRPAVAVFVRDSESKTQPPVKLAQQLFQLTPAETMLAIQLANGMSLEEAAEALNIRRNTARAHLRSIFSKTGVRRQMELVRIFLNSVAWLGTKE
ncbi:helix-turn-helix transcriptional regulator [Alicycliphilus denitrificans]|uniref:helix-turn-helix transcriptional regulator n=1 Tax=Alicycliphilus denitrificans TaxID=179636 RepID=UPI00384A776F